jgi:hypothetical protein
MNTYTVHYNSNNSGGRWWVNNKGWKKLQKAGWVWDNLYRPGEDGTWLGAVATGASKDFEAENTLDAMRQAIAEFEAITGANVADEGCNCCGPPHSFSGFLAGTSTDRHGGEEYVYLSADDFCHTTRVDPW